MCREVVVPPIAVAAAVAAPLLVVVELELQSTLGHCR